MDDKTLLQSLISEIKSLNTRGASDSKVLRDSLAQDSLISQGIKDLNKNFEKSLKDKDDSKKILEEIRDAITDEKPESINGAGIETPSINKLSQIFASALISNNNLIKINEKLNKNIKDLTLSLDKVSDKLSKVFTLRSAIQSTSFAKTNKTPDQNQPLITNEKKYEEYSNSVKLMGEFFNAITNFKVIPAFKASIFMPMIIKNLSKTIKQFEKLDIFGKLKLKTREVLEGEKITKDTFEYSSNIFEGIKSLTESLNNLQNIKMTKLWIQIKLLSIFIIPNLIKGINQFDKVKESSAKKIEKIGETITKVISNLGTIFEKVGKSVLRAGIGLVAMAGSLLLFSFTVKYMQGIEWTQFAAAGAVIVGFLGAMAFAEKFAKNALKTAAALSVFSLSIGAIAYGISLLTNMQSEKILAATLGITAILGVMALIGAFVTGGGALVILAAAAAFGIIGLSFIPLAKGLLAISNIDAGKLADVALSTLKFAGSLLPLVLSAPLIGLLVPTILALGASLFVLSKLTGGLEPTLKFFTGFKSFINDIEIDKIFSLSAAISTLSLAMNAFSAANFSSSIANAFSGIINFFSGSSSPIEQLKELASLTSLSTIGKGIKELAEGMSIISQLQSGSFAAFNEFPWDKLENIAKELEAGSTLQIIPVANANSLNGQKLETTGASMNNSSPVIITNVTNNGGNVSNTSVSNSSRNVRVAPNIELGSALGY